MIVPKIASFVLAAGCLVLIVALPGCGEYGPFDLSDLGDGLYKPPPEVRSVVIVPDSLTLSVGQRANVKAIVTRVDGSVVERGVSFWSSDTTVATVSLTVVPPTAQVTGREIGEAWITARFGPKSGRAKVIVN